MEKRQIILKAFTISAILLVGHVMKGQQNNSLYFTDRIPQSIQLNPALQPTCKFYFGMPALSGIEFNVGNNSIGVSDILVDDNGKTVLPAATKEITAQTLDNLRKSNIIGGSFQLDLFSFGFKVKESFVSFLVSEKANVSTSVPKDLFTFAANGITFGDSYNFNNLGVNATQYREYSVGLSQKIGDRLNFGIRGKLLFGKANISCKQAEVAIRVPKLDSPDWETVYVSSSVKLNTSIPHLEVTTDASGGPDEVKMEDFAKASDFISDYALLKKNKGIGLDLGFQYILTDKVTISGSVVDLGYINWKANVNTITGGGEYQFHGIDMQNDSTLEDDLLDSLKTAYDASVSYDPYITSLAPKLYAGVSYTPNRFIKVGLLSRSEFVQKTFRQQITGTLVMYPTQFLSATVSYTIADRMYDNLGLGLIFRGGPMQMYFMCDRIPLFWYPVKNSDITFIPAYAKGVNFRMGINFVFGMNALRKLKKDQPFLE